MKPLSREELDKYTIPLKGASADAWSGKGSGLSQPIARPCNVWDNWTNEFKGWRVATFDADPESPHYNRIQQVFFRNNQDYPLLTELTQESFRAAVEEVGLKIAEST